MSANPDHYWQLYYAQFFNEVLKEKIKFFRSEERQSILNKNTYDF